MTLFCNEKITCDLQITLVGVCPGNLNFWEGYNVVYLDRYIASSGVSGAIPSTFANLQNL